MNQNQISPEQVAQTTSQQSQQQQMQMQQKPMSMDELQKTQVLNLQDFKETTRIEKLASPMSAKILASLGVFLIAIGVAMPMFQSLSERGKTNKATDTEFREETTTAQKDEKTVIKDLNCRKEMLNNANGTDEVLNVAYTFNDDKLTNYSKEYILKKSTSATEVPAELASYLTALEPFLAVKVTGYNLSVTQIENGSVTKAVVDYASLNYDSIPDTIKNNYRFDVPYKANTSYNDVKTGLEGQGYMCE